MAINGVLFFKQIRRKVLPAVFFKAYWFFYPVFIAAMNTIGFAKHLPPASILF